MASGSEQAGSKAVGGHRTGFAQKIFGSAAAGAEGSPKPIRRGEVAQVPSTVLTVEYVDGSEGMEAAVRALDERLAQLEKVLHSIQEANTELVSVINLQAKQLTQFIESINRRVDRVYRTVAGAAPAPSAPSASLPELETQEFAVPAEYAEDAAHQQAWRIARVMASDLDAYYPEMVREGVVYGNFFELLKDPIEQARQTYRERVPEELAVEVDYLALALNELIATKRRESAEEDAAG